MFSIFHFFLHFLIFFEKNIFSCVWFFPGLGMEGVTSLNCCVGFFHTKCLSIFAHFFIFSFLLFFHTNNEKHQKMRRFHGGQDRSYVTQLLKFVL